MTDELRELHRRAHKENKVWFKDMIYSSQGMRVQCFSKTSPVIRGYGTDVSSHSRATGRAYADWLAKEALRKAGHE